MPRSKIHIFEVKSPGLFYGRESRSARSEEGLRFQELEKRLQLHFNDDQTPNVPYHPTKGEICVAQQSSTKKWCRVEAGNSYQRASGPETECYFVDYGMNELVSALRLRKAIPSMSDVPNQVKRYCLYGIQALTLAIQEDCTVKPEPCLIWDSSAVVFMQNLLREADGFEADVKYVDHQGTVHIILYLRRGGQEICLNDELVRERYGVLKQCHEGDLGDVQDLRKESALLKLKSKLKAKASISPEGSIKSKLQDSSTYRSEVMNANRSPSSHVESNLLQSKLKSHFSDTDQSNVRIDTHHSVVKPTSSDIEPSCKEFIHSPSYSSSNIVSHNKSFNSPQTPPHGNFLSPRSSISPSFLSSGLTFSPTSPVQGAPPSMLNKLLKAVSPSSTPTNMSDSEILKTSPSGIVTQCKTQTDTSSSESVDRSPHAQGGDSGAKRIGKGRGMALLQCLTDRGKSGSNTESDPEKTTRLQSKCASLSMKLLEESSTKVEQKSPGQKSNARFEDPDNRMPVDRSTEVFGQLHGKRLLENLAGKSHKTKNDFSKNALKSAQKDGVLVHSSMPCHPIYVIDEAPLHSHIKEMMRLYVDSNNTLLLQAYAWPPMFRGDHVVGIAPPQTGGKTLGYLATLLTALMHPTSYSDLPSGNGPLAIVLVHSWKKAQALYDICGRLLYGLSKPRVITIYGGGAEEMHYVSLINGCELLIATPPCLMRMISKGHVLLDKLCHLVVDDADILLEEYTSEVQSLITRYSSFLGAERSAPQQFIVMSAVWCSAVQSFITAFMPGTSVIITSRFEAAVFGKVKQVPHMCSSNRRITRITDLLDSISDGVKTIVFCNTVNKVLDLSKILKSLSIFAIEAHSQMELLTLEYKVVDWNDTSNKKNSKLLICDDECLNLLKNLHLDAQIVIHFDMSRTKVQFGNRLACMSQNYVNPIEKQDSKQGSKESEALMAVSHLIFTEECYKQARTVYNLLKRIKCKIPRELRSLMSGMKEGKEENADEDLCLRLKAYGTCKYEHKCSKRHTILPELDAPSHKDLTEGEVKVKIANVVDASRYLVRVLEHRLNGQKFDYSFIWLDLYTQMSTWFRDKLHRIKHANICIGDLCAYDESDVFHRVQILDIKDSNLKGCSTIKVQVQFVDEGRSEKVAMDKLYELPSHLISVPYQMIEVFICRIRPVDRDEDWTYNANTAAHEIMEGKILDGRIVLSIGNTLWLDPLVERQYLPKNKIWINKMFVRSQLLRRGFAVDNANHVQQLYEICKGKITVPETNKTLQRPEESMETDEMPDGAEFHDVYLKEMDLPDLIFLQRNENYNKMEAMVEIMNNSLKDVDPSKGDHSNFKVGSACLSKFDDGKWYRVKILSITGSQVEVFCADYGDKSVVSVNQLYPMPIEFTDLPFQAIECQLAHVKPRGEEWTPESGDVLWDLSHTVNEDNKRLVAKVVGKLPAVYAGIHKYEVELYDTSTADDVNLAQELVWSGLAAPVEGSNLRELSPQPPFMLRKLYKNPIQKIPDLCACIYWNRDQKRPVPPDQEILAIVTEAIKSENQTLISHGGMAPIIKLIGRLCDPTTHGNLLESLLLAAESSDRLSEELLNQDGALSIIKCLEQNSRPEIQEQAVNAISRLIKQQNRFVAAFSEASVIEILCDLLDSATNIKIQVGTCNVLNAVCNKSKNASDLVHHYKLCAIVQNCFGNTSDEDFSQALITLLATLVNRNSKQEQLYREKLAKSVASKVDCFHGNEMCLQYGALYFLGFCAASRKHKTMLLEFGVALTYRKALELPLSLEAKKFCQQLMESLVVNVPKSSLNNQPRQKVPSDRTTQCSSMPDVHWSQNFSKIILKILLPNVKEGDHPVMVTENEFSFRAKVEGKVYAFNYGMYGKIVPSMCKTLIKASEVLVSIRKAEKGRWKRLLKQEHKPANLSIDFERYIDTSSDNSDTGETDEPFLLKKTTRGFPSGLSKPSNILSVPRPPSSSSSDTNSDEDNIYGADYGPVDQNAEGDQDYFQL